MSDDFGNIILPRTESRIHSFRKTWLVWPKFLNGSSPVLLKISMLATDKMAAMLRVCVRLVPIRQFAFIRIPKTTGVEGLLNLLLQKADGLADFGEIWFGRLETSFFVSKNLKPCVLKDRSFYWALCFHLCQVCRVQNSVGFRNTNHTQTPNLETVNLSKVLSLWQC